MIRASLLLACVAFAPLAAAQVYKCGPPSGKGARYQEHACPGGKKITVDDDPAKTPELHENPVQTYLLSQSKGCADFSTILHTSRVMVKPAARHLPEDETAINLFRRECPARGFKLPATAAIHEQNLALHGRNHAKLLKLINDSLPPKSR